MGSRSAAGSLHPQPAPCESEVSGTAVLTPSRPAARTPRARRRRPRPRAWPPCAGPGTSPTRTSSPSVRVGELLLERGERGLGLLDGAARAGPAPAGGSSTGAARRRPPRARDRGAAGLPSRPASRAACAATRRGRRGRRGRREAGGLALLAQAGVLGPAADVGAQRVVLDGDGARADGVEQRAVVGHEQQRALEGAQRVLERLAGLEVEVVRRLVEDEDVRAARDEDRQREALALAAAESPSSGFSASSPLKRKRPSSARAWFGVRPVRLLGGLEHRARAAELELLAVLAEVADLDVVAGAQLAAVERRGARRAPRSASSCRCRWARRATRARRARATARRRASRTRGGSAPTSSRASSSSKITRPERSGVLNWKPSARPSRGSRSMRSILSSSFTRDWAWRAFVAL